MEFTEKRLKRACIGAGLKPEEGGMFMQLYKSMEGGLHYFYHSSFQINDVQSYEFHPISKYEKHK